MENALESKINHSDYKVLIVDDVVSNVLLLKILLQKEGFQICTANNGVVCIELAKSEKPDLILLDVMMPEMNGYDTATVLKQNPETKDIPIIFLTALNTPGDLVKGFQVGANDFLTKPFNKEELVMRVNQQISLVAAKRIIEEQNAELRATLTNRDKILVVGLGNDKFIADSLGPRVLTNIKTNEHIVTFEPCVFGVTGINSVQAILAIAKLVHPTAVIVIDSLVSASPSRIGTNYQICTSGITPGSGIGRDNQTINRKLLGVPVLAIGVPVCTIMTLPQNKIYHVVPKEIDMVIRDCANLIARSLNTLVSQNQYDATKL